MKTLGEVIRDFRIKNDIPQRKIAHELDVDVAVLSRIENDNNFPKKRVFDILDKLSEVLKVNEEELYSNYLADEIALMLLEKSNHEHILKLVLEKVEYLRNKKAVQSKIEF